MFVLIAQVKDKTGNIGKGVIMDKKEILNNLEEILNYSYSKNNTLSTEEKLDNVNVKLLILKNKIDK